MRDEYAAIVARSLGIPLLLGIDPALLEQAEGTEALVDAALAQVTVRPSAHERTEALASIERSRTRRSALAAERHLPSETLDGNHVILRANIATPTDAHNAQVYGADGIGLLRTELPFLECASWPTEAQHAAAAGVGESAAGGRVPLPGQDDGQGDLDQVAAVVHDFRAAGRRRVAVERTSSAPTTRKTTAAGPVCCWSRAGRTAAMP